MSGLTLSPHDKSHRGSASQFFVAGELCRRGWVAVLTLGNCPNTDILCSNKEATTFVHIQVKTFIPDSGTCPVGMKGAHNFGENFFWVLGGIPTPKQNVPFIFYIIPSTDMAAGIQRDYNHWIATPGKKGQQRSTENTMRNIVLPPRISPTGWDISKYANRWDSIESRLISKSFEKKKTKS